jgi:hypothetical protein
VSTDDRRLADFEPGEMLRCLEAHHVRYVVIGAIAAIAAGAPILTTDLDVTPERSDENLERLALALRDLDARLRTASDPGGVSFPIEAAMLGSVENWTLTTRAGNLDLVFSPDGTGGYDDFRRGARREQIAGIRVAVADLADVIRSKEAAGREKDSMQLPILRRTLEQTRSRRREPAGRDR